MAHQPVTELWIQQQGGGAVIQVRHAEPSAEFDSDTRGDRWMRVGVASFVAGMVMASFGSLLAGSLVAVGGVCAVLMARRQQRRSALALPAASTGEPKASPQVRVERARRVLGSLEVEGPCTFEALLARLRWTEPALLETLVELKKDARIDEDLDLDSGQWIYRPMGRHGGAGSLTLDERQSRMHLDSENE